MFGEPSQLENHNLNRAGGEMNPLISVKIELCIFFQEVPIFLALSSNFQSPGTHSKIDPLKGNIDHVLLFSQKQKLQIHVRLNIIYCSGFPGDSVVKNLPANAGHACLIPGLGRSPREGNGKLLQYSCWEIPWTEESDGLQSEGLQNSWTQLSGQTATIHFRNMIIL